jgi:hypothetical protein
MSSAVPGEPELGASATSAAPSPVAPAEDIAVLLRAAPGVVEVTETPLDIVDRRLFVVRFQQPIDHRDPNSATFTQRFTLLYRSPDRPMVLGTSGYAIGIGPGETEITSLLGANQIYLEHRFFGESIPDPIDWSKLDIYQAATDAHRIVTALRPLFVRKWVTTGGSKGGMTSIYHRFFYPNDVDASVPYVAPNSYGRSDRRYITFLENVGDADCRAKLTAFQHEVLNRREEIETRMAAEATAAGDGFQRIGIHKALDYTVTEAPFSFWQYRVATCAGVPPITATTDELYGFLATIYFGDVSSGFGDIALDFFAPYYYQSATELGGPGYAYGPIRDVLTPHFRDLPQSLPPLEVRKPFNWFSMPIVSTWVNAAAQRIMLVFGSDDPWSSGAFTVRTDNDSFRYVVQGGTHRSNLAQLPLEQQIEARATLSRWMDVPIAPPVAPSVAVNVEPTFEAQERSPREELARAALQRRARRGGAP